MATSRHSTGFSNPLGLRNSDVFKKKPAASCATAATSPTRPVPEGDKATSSGDILPSEGVQPLRTNRTTVVSVQTTPSPRGTTAVDHTLELLAKETRPPNNGEDERGKADTNSKPKKTKGRLWNTDLKDLEINAGDCLVFSSLTERQDVAFFRLEKREWELERLQAKLAQLRLQSEAHVVEGLLVLARYNEKIYRGVVKLGNVDANEVLVQLADFGSAAVLKREDVFRAPAEALSEAPTRFCRALRLRHVRPRESELPVEAMVQAAAILSTHQPFLVENVTTEREQMAVTLRSKRSVRFHEEFENALGQVDGGRDDAPVIQSVSTRVGSQLVGYVKHIDKENRIFHFITLEESKRLAEMSHKLKQLLAGEASRDLFVPRKGQLVIVLDDDKLYKRARVEDIQAANYECKLVDYGDEKCFPASALRPVPPFCKEYPCFARPCRIVIDSDEDLATVMFQDLKVSQNESILVKGATSRGIYNVELGER